MGIKTEQSMAKSVADSESPCRTLDWGCDWRCSWLDQGDNSLANPEYKREVSMGRRSWEWEANVNEKCPKVIMVYKVKCFRKVNAYKEPFIHRCLAPLASQIWSKMNRCVIGVSVPAV